jgi:hypothetical protein
MVNFPRPHRGASSSNTAHRTSVASNITTHSNKAGSHNSFILSAAKRVVSVFDARASWATTTSVTMGSSDEKENMPPSSVFPGVTSETASDTSVDKTKKLKRSGFVQTIVAKLESNKNGSDKKEYRDVQESARNSVSPIAIEKMDKSEISDTTAVNVIAESSKNGDRKENEQSISLTRSSEVRADRDSSYKSLEVLREATNTESCDDVVPPLATKQGAIRKLRSVASRMDLVKREKSVKRTKKRPESGIGTGGMHDLDHKLEESWLAKVDALAAWAEQCLTNGRMPYFDIQVMKQANDILIRESEDVDDFGSVLSRAAKLLTPEEDLVACFQRTSCHPHQTAYFAKILKEV